MIKLLNAGFTRLRKNKLFWILSIFSIGLALLMIYNGYVDMNKYGSTKEVEQLMLNYAMMIGIVIAIFTSLFLGVEYSDGAIRNKISIGHKRINIYLSNLIIIGATSVFSYIVYLLISIVIGIPLFGNITIPITSLLALLGCLFAAIIAYASIFTFTAMIISNKTIIAIVTMMLAFGMIMGALTCQGILQAPKTIQEATMVNGEAKLKEVPNPRYPSERKKKVCKTLLDINPAGQMYQITGKSISNLKMLSIYSLGNLVIFTTIGVILFNKKELK